MGKIKLSKIKANPNNPRLIKDDKFKKLVKSIEAFPAMLDKRPIVCVTDTDGKIYPLGGNMRLKALKELSYSEIPETWVTMADDWTEEQKREFIIKDNVGYGEWDWDDLANNWDAEQLTEWGLDIPNFDNSVDYSDKNKEIDIDSLDSLMTIKLNYTEEDYIIVMDRLKTIAQTPEQAIWKLLGYE
jgi:ParB-like chromosome segregation protein Spo0J